MTLRQELGRRWLAKLQGRVAGGVVVRGWVLWSYQVAERLMA